MSYVIVVTPADPEFRDVARVEDLLPFVRADLEGLRDEVGDRFPAAEAVGETGALSERPVIEGVGVVLRPEVLTRSLVVNAVMRLAAPRQLLVTSPPQGLVADPRERIDIDVHRRPTTMGAAITDHAILGRPRGTLPWVTRELLGQLVGTLEVEGDRLELEADPDRWLRYERRGRTVQVTVADGPDVPVRETAVGPDRVAAAVDCGWDWARCHLGWSDMFTGGGAVAGPAAA